MRSLFVGHYRKTDDQLEELWKQCLFIFDTNVLLHLYLLSSASRKEYVEVLNQIADRIWIPYQVALEYHANRLGKIDDARKQLDVVENSLDGTKEDLVNFVRRYDRYAQSGEPGILTRIDELISQLQAFVDQSRKEQEATLGESDGYSRDVILDELSELFTGCCVGLPYGASELQQKYVEGSERFQAKTPPGYDDVKKPEPDRYGDYIIWSQILDKACTDQTSIVFITEDAKDDWWLKRNGKTIGPRPELIAEMHGKAGVDFHMYDAASFLRHGIEWLDSRVSEDTIEEVSAARRTIQYKPSVFTEGSDLLSELGLSTSSSAFEELARSAFLPALDVPDVSALANFDVGATGVQALVEAVEANRESYDAILRAIRNGPESMHMSQYLRSDREDDESDED